jgi:hypothetical protein
MGFPSRRLSLGAGCWLTTLPSGTNRPSSFGVFMLEAVIGGLGDELIDLAKVNLFR